MKKYFPVVRHINVPNTVTTIGLACGIAACYYLLAGSLRSTLICLSLAMLMDLLDGFFAEKLNSQTNFGKSLDSLVDSFTCCIMPVLMAFNFVGTTPLLIGGAAFFCICGLWRLANFNVTSAEGAKHFTGMPVPGAAMLAAMAMWAVVYYGLPVWVCVAAFVLAGFLMLSFLQLEKYGAWQKVFWLIGIGFWAVIVLS